MRRREGFLQILVAAVLGVGAAAVATPAHATVARYQMQYAVLSISVYADHSNVHVFDITRNPCDGSFTGTADPLDWVAGETIAGSLVGQRLDFTARYPSGYWWFGSGPLTAFTGGSSYGTVFDSMSATVGETMDITRYPNHRAFVRAHPELDDAAHACIGEHIKTDR